MRIAKQQQVHRRVGVRPEPGGGDPVLTTGQVAGLIECGERSSQVTYMHVCDAEKPQEVGTELVGVLPGFGEGAEGGERPVASLARLGRAGGSTRLGEPAAADSLQLRID